MAQIEHRIIYYKNGKFVQYLLNIVFSLRVTKVWNQPTWFISLGGPGRDVDGEPFICDGLNLKKKLKKRFILSVCVIPKFKYYSTTLVYCSIKRS